MSSIDIAALAGLTARRVVTSGGHRAVSLEREYAFAIDDVWSAWTAPERTRRWLGELRGDLVVGGRVELCMSPPDSDVAVLTILACDAPERLVVRWEWPGEVDSFVDLRLCALDAERTLLVLEHVALEPDKAHSYGPGWEDFLLRLALNLAGDDPATLRWAEVEPVIDPQWLAAETASPSQGSQGSAASRPSDWSDNRWPLVAAGDNGSSLVASRVVVADRDDVWSALTTADRIGAWFGAVTGDLAIGGDVRIVFDGGAASGTVRECDRSAGRIVLSWRWDHDGLDTTVSVSLVDVGAGRTRVIVRQDGVVGPTRGYAAGWAAYLGALERALGGAPRSEQLWQAEWELAMAMLAP